MSVELSDEEKVKFAEHLKELGYDDHAQKTIARLNKESQTHRERAEAEEKARKEAEEKAKGYETEAQRKAREAEEARLAEENAKKSVDEKIKALEETFSRELTKREQSLVEKQNELLAEMKARDSQILMQAVRAAAKERGIIDESLVSLIDVSSVPIEKGVVNLDKVYEVVDAHAEAKPALYKTAEERARNDRGQFVQRPSPSPPDKSKNLDASKLNDEDFDALEARLRQTRA